MSDSEYTQEEAPSICAKLGRCAYDVANKKPDEGCPWWSDCFGAVEDPRDYDQPATKTCIERGCKEPAGTPWGPHWCARHDVLRLDRIGRQLRSIQADLEAVRLGRDR